MNGRKLVPVLVLVAAAAAGLVYHFGIAGSKGDGKVVHVSGNIEVTDAEVSFKIPGRVEERPVDEGYQVTKDKTMIAVLDQRDLKAELAMREAELATAKAAWDEIRNGTRKEDLDAAKAAMEKADAARKASRARPEEIRMAETAVDSTLAEKQRTATELARAKHLLETQAIGQETYDQQKASDDVASARLEEMRQRLDAAKKGLRFEDQQQAEWAYEQAKAQYDLAVHGARPEVRQQAIHRVEQAQAAVELAKVKLDYATVYSPLSGVVLSKNVEPGEYVSAGTPVVTVGDLSHPWLRAYIEETDLDRVKYDQEAVVRTDGRPGKTYKGRVGFIASEAEFTPKSVQTEKERTRLVYRIKIYVDNPEWELKRGMPAEADILLNVGQDSILPADK